MKIAQNVHDAAQEARWLIEKHNLTEKDFWEMLAHVTATSICHLEPAHREIILEAILGMSRALVSQIDQLAKTHPDMQRELNKLRGAH